MRIQKGIDRGKDTHSLETVEGGACQDMERNRPSKGPSLSGDGRGRVLSGYGKKSMVREALTPWRWRRMGLVRTWKGTGRARGTHDLDMIKGGSSQATERNQPIKEHSLPGDSRGRDLSEHGKRPTKRGALTNWSRWRGACQHKE